MNRTPPDNQPAHQPVAAIQNNWPRPGLAEGSVNGQGYLGRFAAHQGRWCFEDVLMNVLRSGTGNPLPALEALLRDQRATKPDAGAIGYIAYEFGYDLLAIPRPVRANDDFPAVPDLQFLVYANLDRTRVAPRTGAPLRSSYRRIELDRMIASDSIHRATTRAAYAEHVGRIREHIAAGDIYQANYTQAFDLISLHDPKSNFRQLVDRCPAPYNAFLRFPAWSAENSGGTIDYPPMVVFGGSPERLLRKTGARLETRPIKGTIGRANTHEAERDARRRLLGSAKDRAELLMITDLERNDLGMVAKTGSVHVEALARVRRAPSVWHLESTITAQARANATWADVIFALFPCGSITGAPKRRAVEIIAELETTPRGVYCGAYGWVDGRGDCNFAVAIRTAVQIGHRIRVCGGGGIVYDSDLESEYYESLIKIAPLIEAFSTTDESADSPVSARLAEREPTHA